MAREYPAATDTASGCGRHVPSGPLAVAGTRDDRANSVQNAAMETARTRPSHRGSTVIRSARFEDVPEVLRIIARAVEEGCAHHYDRSQRRAVVQSYGSHLFVEALERFQLVVAEKDGRLVGAAQLDPADGRLRALFVDDTYQGRGVGGALLAEIEARAIRRGLRRLYGAMALNAVPFYARHGFRRGVGPSQLSGRVLVPVVAMEKPLGANLTR
jgi:putative acetyltransferase